MLIPRKVKHRKQHHPSRSGKASGGTADDPDVDFGDDAFIPAEGFTGTEDTLGRIAFGITS